MQGTVEKFWNDRGWGFIKGNDGGNYFIHHTGIIGEGRKNLIPGQSVEFVPGENDKGKIAINVRVVQQEVDIR